MFQLFVITTKPKLNSLHTLTISFDTDEAADLAYDRLVAFSCQIDGSVQVEKLY